MCQIDQETPILGDNILGYTGNRDYKGTGYRDSCREVKFYQVSVSPEFMIGSKYGNHIANKKQTHLSEQRNS